MLAWCRTCDREAVDKTGRVEVGSRRKLFPAGEMGEVTIEERSGLCVS